MERLVRFAVVDIMSKLHFVSTVDVVVVGYWRSLLTRMRRQRLERMMRNDFTHLEDVLGLVSLVDSSPDCEVTLRILRIRVVEVDEELLQQSSLFMDLLFLRKCNYHFCFSILLTRAFLD